LRASPRAHEKKKKVLEGVSTPNRNQGGKGPRKVNKSLENTKLSSSRRKGGLCRPEGFGEVLTSPEKTYWGAEREK